MLERAWEWNRMRIPPPQLSGEGFDQEGWENYVCKLQQTSRAWNIKLNTILTDPGLIVTIPDPCVYVSTSRDSRGSLFLHQVHQNMTHLNVWGAEFVSIRQLYQCRLEEIRTWFFKFKNGSDVTVWPSSILCVEKDRCVCQKLGGYGFVLNGQVRLIQAGVADER